MGSCGTRSSSAGGVQRGAVDAGLPAGVASRHRGGGPCPDSCSLSYPDACLAKADRNIIESAQVEPGNRFSYRYADGGGSGAEVETFVACMQGRAPAYPAVR